ncbi:putative cytoplasm protein [Dioszegia hungarica]|uniref:Cytoplasm protein n=1 Tax=Dioszegia hungarica TaxID=4972 RepID=A0AA38LTT4_9TREE|nr:putative cytoplasm protein [Dioszegia hungarica]KAI9634963.1 putative cytoplasm protein [Dioszegia hungarica]
MDPEDEAPELIDIDDASPYEGRTGSSVNDGDTSASAGSSRSAAKVDAYERRKVPLTILTGYLGAGKSTLLDYILKEQHGYKIAVCMNDFGDSTDIEAKSLTLTDPNTGAQSSQFLSLPNGCLCCSFKDMGIAAIEEMAHQEGVEWVMVELTGLADPGPIIRGFWENEEMGDLILDGVVCVVDCRNVLKQLSEQRPAGEVNEAQKQVACADVILLNKTDLVDSGRLSQVEETISAINPTLRVYKTQHSITPLDGLFDLRAFTSAPLAPTTIPPASSHTHTSESSDHAHDDSHDHNDRPSQPHAHFGRITTITIPIPSLSSDQFDRLQRFLEDTLWSIPDPPSATTSGGIAIETAEKGGRPEVLRTKGLVRTAEGREYVLQGVTDVFELKELPSSGSGGGSAADGGKVVFIGKGVDERLKDRLLAAVNV